MSTKPIVTAGAAVSGLRGIAPLRWTSHVHNVYADASAMLRTVAQFLAEGARHGQFGLWLVTDADELSRAKQALAAVPLSTDGRARGEIEVREASAFEGTLPAGAGRGVRAAVPLHAWDCDAGAPAGAIVMCNAPLDAAAFDHVLRRLRAGERVIASDDTGAVELSAAGWPALPPTFLRTVAHDMRTPISSAFLATDLVGEHVVDDPFVTQTTDRIRRASQRLRRIADDLSAVGEAMSGFSTEPRAARASGCCQRVIDRVAETNQRAQVSLDVRGDDAGMWDVDRIETALECMVIDALQWGSSAAQLTCEQVGGYQQFTVSFDPGVKSREALADLLDAFGRSSRGVERRSRACGGLGAYVVAAIAAAHGGSVWAESDLDSHTSITLAVPVSPVS